MRKRSLKLGIYALLGLITIYGCKPKKAETLPRTSSREQPRNASSDSEKSTAKFVLREITVEQKATERPNHVLRVNQKFIAELQKHSLNGKRFDESIILELWHSYFEGVLHSERLMTALDSNVSVSNLLQESLKKEVFSELSSFDDEGLSLQDRENLYGSYMAVALSASNGAETLDQFFSIRANDSEIRKVDLYLYRIALGALDHLKNTASSPRLDQWQSYAEAKNPICRLIALQMGDQFTLQIS